MPKLPKGQELVVEGKKLTTKQRIFVAEYLIDLNAQRAAIEAGYSVKSAAAMGAQLIKEPHIAAAIKTITDRLVNRLEMKKEHILAEVGYCALRDPIDLIDPNTGQITTDLRRLPERVRRTVDAIKQKVKRYTDAEGEEVVEVETELKLVPKAAALDMAMKHFGLYAATKVEGTLLLVDWDKMWTRQKAPGNVIDTQAIEKEGQ